MHLPSVLPDSMRYKNARCFQVAISGEQAVTGDLLHVGRALHVARVAERDTARAGKHSVAALPARVRPLFCAFLFVRGRGRQVCSS